MKYAPIKNYSPKKYPAGSVTQYFGENKALYEKVCTNGICLSGGHNGCDIVDAWGTPIFSVDEGEVVEVKESSGGYGKHIRILCKENDVYAEWTYGHLSRIDVKVGQKVKGGEQIGLMGNTGFVVSGATPFWKHNPYAGTHLHLGKRLFKEWNGAGTYNISYNNGKFKGSIIDYPGAFMGSVPFDLNVGNADSVEYNKIALTFTSLVNKLALLLGKKVA